MRRIGLNHLQRSKLEGESINRLSYIIWNRIFFLLWPPIPDLVVSIRRVRENVIPCLMAIGVYIHPPDVLRKVVRLAIFPTFFDTLTPAFVIK
jgi:hypothetical protein